MVQWRRLSPSIRNFVVVPLLLVVGVQTWLIVGRSDYGRNPWHTLMIAAALLLLGAVGGRHFTKLLDRVRTPSPRARCVSAALIVPAVTGYLVFTGWSQGRDFHPKWQDEQSYIIQFRMLSEGRLWMPRHELGDFFDSFQVIIDPVYASMYFPGAALWYTPAQFVGLPFWFMSALAAGIAAALLYLVITQLIDGVAGVLSVLMLIALFQFRKISLLIGGHPPMLVAEMGLIYCYLCWRESRSLGWAAAMGALAGWAAIIRPLDALVVATPVGIMMILNLWKQPLRLWARTGAALALPAIPFLALQIVFNIGVTGSWYRTPFDHYADRDYPGTRLGFHRYDPDRRPASVVPQKQKYYDDFAVPAIQRHRPDKVIENWFGGPRNEFDEEQTGYLPRVLADGMPHRLMFILLPVGLLGLVTRPRLAVWLIHPAFVMGFSFYTFNLPHYAIITAPAVILWVLLGKHIVETAWPRIRHVTGTFLALAIVVLSCSELAEFNRLVLDEPFDPQGLRNIRAAIANLEHKPAVVLFRYDPRLPGDEEPVYNMETAWPDDAQVIRAHDLGEQNIEIFRYYARRQPDRAFYLYDRGDDTIEYIGTARDLAGLGVQ